MLTEQELRDWIKELPKGNIAAAYRLGLKDKSLELAPQIEELLNKK